MESRFACFYLTGQLEWILRKFQLAEVVLVVSKPHVFNLTGQLVSTPPECSTLAATDLVRSRDLGHEMRLISSDLISRSHLEVSYETQP